MFSDDVLTQSPASAAQNDGTQPEPRDASTRGAVPTAPVSSATQAIGAVEATADDSARSQTPSPDAIREAAAKAAGLGYQIVALHGVDANGACTCRKGSSCPAAGKHPRGHAWLRKAGTLARFRQYTDGGAAFNLGLRLDADVSVPLVLFDVDTKHGKPGAASLAQLEAELGPLPEGALLQTTPTGGSHYLLRLPEGIDLRALGTGTGLLPGLDVYTHRRQFVLSPSRTGVGAYTLVDQPRGLPAPSALKVLPENWVHWLQGLAARSGAAPTSTETVDPPDVAPDPQLVVRLLELLPAPAENTRDDAVGFAIACHGALANAEPADQAAAEVAFLQWAGRWPGAYPEHDQHIWDTTKKSKQRGWRQFRSDAQRFLERARVATNAEEAGLVDGADLDAAQALLDTVRQDQAQRAFPALDATQLAPVATARVTPPVLVKSFADVRPRPIEWLLEGRLARQHITMINGWPGEGKTSVVIDIVARLTTGEPLPDGSVPPRRLRVLFLSSEDSESILQLRLRAAGADMTRVFTIPDTLLEQLTLPSHTETWIGVLREYEIDLVVVDPMKSFLDDDLKDIAEQDARKFMQALKQIAERTDVAAICIRHPNKATAAGHSTAISAASGSLGFTAAARIGLLVGRMPDDEEIRALVHVKNNIAEPPVGLLYRIVSKNVLLDEGSTQDVASIEWQGVNDEILADDLLAKRENREQRSKLEAAKEFLRNYLATGPVEHSAVRAAAKRHGIKDRTLERARDTVGWWGFVGSLKTGGKSVWGLKGQSAKGFKEPNASTSDAPTAGKAKGNDRGRTSRQNDQTSEEEPLNPPTSRTSKSQR